MVRLVLTDKKENQTIESFCCPTESKAYELANWYISENKLNKNNIDFNSFYEPESDYE